MKVIRVFPRRTSHTPDDGMAFVGDPPLFRPPADEVHVSCTFTWDIDEANRLAEAWGAQYPGRVKLGGPALDDPGGEFTPGLYVKYGLTITSRGCPRRCRFCFVPRREGALRTLSIRPGHVINDNTLLACAREHVEAVFDMLRGQRGVNFRGGLDVRLLRPWHVAAFKGLSVSEFWFAADYPRDWTPLERAADSMADFPRRKKRCYVLLGFGGDTPRAAVERLEHVWGLGFLPFAAFYRGPGGRIKTREWAAIQREWSRPAAMVTRHRTDKETAVAG